MMTQQTLIVFAIFVERSGKVDQTMSAKQSQQALAVFFFFLFLIYSAFGTMLSVFRNDIIKDGRLLVLQSFILIIMIFIHYYRSIR